MIQTIKRRLSCLKAENKDTFSTAKAIKQIVSDLRFTNQKTTKITPFEAHFGRSANTPLRNISTLPSSLNLTYEKIVNHYLDAETVSAEDLLDETGWISANRSDIEIEQKMCQASLDAGQRYRILYRGQNSPLKSNWPENYHTRNEQNDSWRVCTKYLSLDLSLQSRHQQRRSSTSLAEPQ